MSMNESDIRLATAVSIAATLNRIEGAGLKLRPDAVQQLYEIAARAKPQRRRHVPFVRHTAGRGAEHRT